MITVQHVKRFSLSGGHSGLDLPAAGNSYPGFVLPVAGWCYGKNLDLRRIRIYCGSFVIRAVALNLPRPDVARFLLKKEPPPCGFSTHISVLGCPEQAVLKLEAHDGKGRAFPIAKVELTFSLEDVRDPASSEALNPVLVTGLGRSGTTMLMKWLDASPEILVGRPYPYELRVARYWLQTLHVLSQPALDVQHYHPDNFCRSPRLQPLGNFLGPNPFHYGLAMQQDELNSLWTEQQPAHTLSFVRERIQDAYHALASDKPKARYFAEKHPPDFMAQAQRTVSPGAREIFIVRDFRDTLASILAFNAKRGAQSFGMDRFDSTVAFIQAYARTTVRDLTDSWQARKDQSLLITYENAVRYPDRERARIAEYLGVDMVAPAEPDSEQNPSLAMAEHRTTSSAEASIGRWESSLKAKEKKACERALGDALTAFGYI